MDVLEGLVLWLTEQVEARMAGQEKNDRIRLLKNNRMNFHKIFNALDFT